MCRLTQFLPVIHICELTRAKFKMAMELPMMQSDAANLFIFCEQDESEFKCCEDEIKPFRFVNGVQNIRFERLGKG